MDYDFWRDRWRSNEIGFHQPDYNPWLVKYWPGLGLADGARVFVPLCGKSLDMRWLVAQGHQVQGIELIEAAIEGFFAELGEPYERKWLDRFARYRGRNIELWCGDFFQLTAADLQAPAAVFDRAALVALPEKQRYHYADHLLRIIPDGAQILLLTLEYPQERVAGPPFSVSAEEVTIHFEERCAVERLQARPTDVLPPKFKARGVDEAVESVYRITKER